MGGGTWNAATYASTTAPKIASGAAFGSTSHARTTGVWKLDEALDPAKLNADGVIVRESRDSDEHPTSKAIAVFFDHTGSMGDVPIELQKRLPNLLELLLKKGYVEDPQILFGAVGDATCDEAPIQVGQFESDNRMDETLDKILLYRGGGGQNMESYELTAWFMANYASMDCLDKRGEKGYLFIIGDEQNYPVVSADHIRTHVSDSILLEGDVPTEQVYAQLLESFDVYFLIPPHTLHYNDPLLINHWENLLGVGKVVKVESLDAINETIGTLIGISEGTITLDDVDTHLADLGASTDVVTAVKSAVKDVAVREEGHVTAVKPKTMAVGGMPDTSDEEDGIS